MTLQDNICLEEINVHERIEQFVTACQHIANVTRGNDIMLTMGTDFTYSNSWPWCVCACACACSYACVLVCVQVCAFVRVLSCECLRTHEDAYVCMCTPMHNLWHARGKRRQ